MTAQTDLRLARYVAKALQSYRRTTYGQFDQEYRHTVQETQDGAEIIGQLIEEVESLRKELNKP